MPVAQYLRMSTEHQRYSTTNQREAIDGDTAEPPQRHGEHGGLVKPSPPQPRRMERHRNDEIGVGEEFGACLGEPAREQGQALMPVAILKLWTSSRMASE